MTVTISSVVLGLFLIFFFLAWWVLSRIQKAGPNEVLVISGRRRWIKREDGTKFLVGFRMLKGGRTFVYPFIERVDRLSLELFTLDVRTPEVYTAKGVPIIVDGIAQVKIKGDDVSIATASEQFLSMGIEQIRQIALQTVEGHLRAILGTLTVEETYSNRDMFASKVQEVASSDLANMGLLIVSFTIRDIRDSQGYLDALGKKRTAEVKRDAKIGEALANQEGEEAKFDADTKIAEAERDYQMKRADYTASVNKEKAKADLAYDLQRYETAVAVKTQEIQVEIVEREKRIEVQDKEIQRRQRELTATIEKPAEAEKFKVLTLADAEKYKLQTEADGAASATKLKGFAEADVIQRTGEAQAEANRARGFAEADVIKAQGLATAEAMEKKAEAWRNYNEAAIVQMFIDKIPDIARAIAEPLAKTDRIVIINSGGGDGGAGASRITKDVTDIIAQIPPVIEGLTGIDMETLIKNIPAIREGMFKEHGWQKGEGTPPKSK